MVVYVPSWVIRTEHSVDDALKAQLTWTNNSDLQFPSKYLCLCEMPFNYNNWVTTEPQFSTILLFSFVVVVFFLLLLSFAKVLQSLTHEIKSLGATTKIAYVSSAYEQSSGPLQFLL